MLSVEKNDKVCYKVMINDFGQVHTIYTYAKSMKQAKQLAYHQLSKRLKIGVAGLSMRLNNTNRVEVREEKQS